MIKRIPISKEDQDKLQSIITDSPTQADDFFDYRNVVIKKPWGHEYLIFQNDESAVWILHMKKGYKTSMHCHPRKKTSLIILAGEARCSTLMTQKYLKAGEGLLLDKGVFHQTESVTPDWIILMEVETPVNKHDLVRVDDAYGRVGRRYEGHEYHSVFDDSICHFYDEGRYNCTKKIGDCELTIVNSSDVTTLKDTIHKFNPHIVTLLKGNVCDPDKECIMEVGDSMLTKDFSNYHDPIPNGEIEYLLIKKI